MSASPFQSILDVAQPQPKTTSKPAIDEQSLDDMIAGLLARQPTPLPSGAASADATRSVGCHQSVGTLMPISRPELKGGVYSEPDALNLLNAHFLVGKSKQEIAIFRIDDDGTISFVPTEEFKLAVQNIFVRVKDKSVPAEKYWRESPKRHEKVLVFKPGGTTQPDEYNLWRGFGIELRKGWQKQRRFLRHLRRVICRRDKHKFKYLMRLLAWFVQNPDKHAGVVLVLKSREQGTGKSTVGKVMLDIFGQHGFLVDDKDRLLGRFNDWLEKACFVLAEEILFAGDLKAADKMKSMVSSDMLPIERKFGSVRQVPNRMKVIATTNHDHAVAAGSRERRNVVYDVSNEHVGDREWFDKLYQDLEDGGTSQFLWLLLNLRLGTWHPRMTIATAETAEQQRMSADSVSQWAQACVIADAVVGRSDRECHLGEPIASEYLRAAYTGYCKQQGLRPVGEIAFGKACTEMFGPRRRLPERTNPPEPLSAEEEELDRLVMPLVEHQPSAEHTQITPARPAKRPWGYDVPDGETWQVKINERLGLRK
jgi:hypothetical protein